METGGWRKQERTRTGVREKGTVRPVKAPIYIWPGPGHRQPSKLVNLSTKCAKRNLSTKCATRATCRQNVLREQHVNATCKRKQVFDILINIEIID